MGRELSIWKRLIRLDGPELVNGALAMLATVAPNLEAPRTLRLFYAANTTPLYEQCKAEWFKSDQPAKSRAKVDDSPMKPLTALIPQHERAG